MLCYIPAQQKKGADNNSFSHFLGVVLRPYNNTEKVLEGFLQ